MDTAFDLRPVVIDDLHEIQFCDLFTIEAIQRMQDLYSDATGVASIIILPDGTPVTRPSNFSRFCNNIVHNTKEGRANCFFYKAATEGLKVTGSELHCCMEGGLWDAGARITVGGKHLASWLIGQVRNKETDIHRIIEFAHEVGANSIDLKEALIELPVMSEDQFNKVSKMLYALANELSEKAFVNLQLRKQIDEREHTIRLLQESKDRFQHISSTISDISYSCQIIPGGKISVDWITGAVERITGYTIAEIIALQCWGKLVITEDLELFNQNVIGLNIGGSENCELRLRHKSGKIVWVSSSAECVISPDQSGILLIYGALVDITERKRGEEALRESEEKFRMMTDLLPQVIFETDINGNFVFVNKQAFKIFGYPEDFKILGVNSLNFHLPESRERAIENIGRIISGKPITNNEYIMVRKDGSTFPALVYSNLILKDNKPAGLRGIIIDISERKQVEERLHESELRYRLLIDTANEGILVGQGSMLMFVNPMIMELTGYTREELLSSPFLEFIHPDDRSLLVTNQQKRLKGEVIDLRYPLRVMRKDKAIKWVEMSGVKIEWEGKPATMNFVSDITQRRKAEEELIIQNEKLQKSNAEKDKFFSIIAHDLRSPFSGFLGLTQIMAEELPSLTMAEIQEIAVSLRNSATNLFRLLENLLQWSRIKQGHIPFDPVINKLLPIIEESITMVLESSKNKGIEIVNTISNDIVVFADINLLQTVFRNLFSNAVKFTHRGGTVNLSSKPTKDKTLEIIIRDSGIGMSPAMVDQLFQLDAKTGRKGTEGEVSTGLGLLLCKEFIEIHGGKLRVESEEGEGSAFYITIPQPSLGNNP
jgi:PAS domain S-box-containing protein